MKKLQGEADSVVFGFQDSSYRAAGEEKGLRKLSTDFYLNMDQFPEAIHIRNMHKEDLNIMIDKLTLFLCMWLGGPRIYLKKYGNANMVQAHRHLVINEKERDAWLLCMDQAVDVQKFSDDFKGYLKKQFRFPANMIQKTSKFK